MEYPHPQPYNNVISLVKSQKIPFVRYFTIYLNNIVVVVFIVMIVASAATTDYLIVDQKKSEIYVLRIRMYVIRVICILRGICCVYQQSFQQRKFAICCFVSYFVDSFFEIEQNQYASHNHSDLAFAMPITIHK